MYPPPPASDTKTVTVLTGVTVGNAFATPTTQTIDSAPGWKNICVTISGSATLKGFGIYVTNPNGGGFAWKVSKAAGCSGARTLIDDETTSGPLSQTLDNTGYLNAKLAHPVNACSCSGDALIFEINMTAGATYRSSTTAAASGWTFSKYSTGSSTAVTNTGTYALRLAW